MSRALVILAFYTLVLSISLWFSETTSLSSNYQGMKLGMGSGKWLGHLSAFKIANISAILLCF